MSEIGQQVIRAGNALVAARAALDEAARALDAIFDLRDPGGEQEAGATDTRSSALPGGKE